MLPVLAAVLMDVSRLLAFLEMCGRDEDSRPQWPESEVWLAFRPGKTTQLSNCHKLYAPLVPSCVEIMPKIVLYLWVFIIFL